MSASYGQAGPRPVSEDSVSGNRTQAVAPVNPQSLSCDDLKADLKRAGTLRVLSGPSGAWGDTFYGPSVPRCPFWQMPQFTYVRTRDRLCGVGYICVDKYSMD
jgi:hypothetical protein